MLFAVPEQDRAEDFAFCHWQLILDRLDQVKPADSIEGIDSICCKLLLHRWPMPFLALNDIQIQRHCLPGKDSGSGNPVLWHVQNGRAMRDVPYADAESRGRSLARRQSCLGCNCARLSRGLT